MDPLVRAKTPSLQVTLQREGFADKTFTFDHAFGPSVPNIPRVEKNTGVWGEFPRRNFKRLEFLLLETIHTFTSSLKYVNSKFHLRKHSEYSDIMSWLGILDASHAIKMVNL